MKDVTLMRMMMAVAEHCGETEQRGPLWDAFSAACAAGYPARREKELAVIEAARDVIASIAPIEHDDMRYFSAGDAEDFERLRSAVRAYNKSAEEKP